jgi:hypothetical protein
VSRVARTHQHLPLFGEAPPPRIARPARSRAVHASDFARRPKDFYATPAWVTEALLRHVSLRGPVWEPCCGDGAMARVLAAHGLAVQASDIADRGFGDSGIDFLACTRLPAGCRSIVTNPPYGEAAPADAPRKSATALLDFLRHALGLTAGVRGQLALLVRLQWLAGQRAAALLSAAPFAATIVLTRRIRWFDMGAETNHGQHHHAWIVIDHAHPPGAPPALLYG